MSTNVCVLLELENKKIKPANLGMITLVRSKKPGNFYAIAVNADKPSVNEELSRFGVENVIHISLPQEFDSNPDILARAIVDTVTKYEITSVFGLSTSQGKDILPRIAAIMDIPLVMDCVDVDLEQSIARTSQFSGKTMATVKLIGDLIVVGVRPNVTAPEKKSVKLSEILHDPGLIEPHGLAVLNAGKTSGRTGTSLTEANVIVSGGRGIKNSENFSLIRQCARLLNGAAGASRVAVDSGWVPYAMQIGQTGEKVSPQVYIACGISGSIQHFAGMKTAGMVIAINTDENAAMIANSDYYVIGDALEILPELNRILDHE